MRKEFSKIIEQIGCQNTKIVFLTGDLGFLALENLRDSFGNRFINVGVSEQNMISMAAAMASEGLTPICYSIAPFLIYRPAEQIKIDVCLHNMNVKLVGNGGGYGYGIMGATHHALEDISIASSFPNMKCYIPFCNEDVDGAVIEMLNNDGPSYLRLGFGCLPPKIVLEKFKDIRLINRGNKLTIIGLGPIILNVLNAINNQSIENDIDVFTISLIPVTKLSEEFIKSIIKTSKLIIVEEHGKRGGLGEYISLLLLENNLICSVKHICAVGYPDGLYGSQDYHLKKSRLDTSSLSEIIYDFINEQRNG